MVAIAENSKKASCWDLNFIHNTPPGDSGRPQARRAVPLRPLCIFDYPKQEFNSTQDSVLAIDMGHRFRTKCKDAIYFRTIQNLTRGSN